VHWILVAAQSRRWHSRHIVLAQGIGNSRKSLRPSADFYRLAAKKTPAIAGVHHEISEINAI